MTSPAPSAAPTGGRGPARVVVVVPRRETRLHEYLRRSLAALANVEVVLDRRATAMTPANERRRRQAKQSERRILICSLVRCPDDAPAPPTAESSSAHDAPRPRRTLLWPDLRLDNL